MSEYQYYDFYAIDKPLTQEQIAVISTFSSRTHPTPRRATFEYNYGDFSYNQEEVVSTYFDMMLYVANWGSRQLLMKFPIDLVPFKTLQKYQINASDFAAQEIRVFKKEKHVFINLEMNLDEGDWIEGEGLLDGLLPLREQILLGDHRVLYLAWKYLDAQKLSSKGAGGVHISKTPPIPPNMGKIDASLQEFISFWEIDVDLVDSAIKESPVEEPIPEEVLISLIKELPNEEKDRILSILLKDRQRAQIELKNHLKAL
ncbi:MAG: hypothetical protein AAF655_24690 [Bacteroidota bacterium]